MPTFSIDYFCDSPLSGYGVKSDGKYVHGPMFDFKLTQHSCMLQQLLNHNTARACAGLKSFHQQCSEDKLLQDQIYIKKRISSHYVHVNNMTMFLHLVYAV